MKTDNELIAEFMGVNKLHYSNGILWDTSQTGKEIYALRSEHLRYDSSWDWLMPVVEKIKTIGYDSTMIICALPNEKDKMMIHTTTDIISEHSGDSLIKSVYKAVVEFIKWHNS